jgi:hypothetical protein
MMIKRFDSLDITTADLADAISTYQNNFDVKIQRTGEEATIEIGLAQIRLRSGEDVADVISTSGEGLAAVWLEAEDVDRVVEKMKQAHIAVSPIRLEGNRRILAVDPGSTNTVPLFIFDRRG